jgi:putative NADH-flavin reductase
MNLPIFGATCATGRHLVRQALDLGHCVTAFLRDPARLPIAHSSLHHVVGDVMSSASVEAAVPGQTAILCALGDMTEGKADLWEADPFDDEFPALGTYVAASNGKLTDNRLRR